jgi:FMN phosphatase YigB (HAD superfamily)
VKSDRSTHAQTLECVERGIAISELVGARKPDREIFEAAARTATGRLDEAVVIGDDADIGGG